MKYADVGDAYFTRLYEAKYDIKAALESGVHAIIGRDYKTYDLKIGKMGVAVAPAYHTTMFEHYGIDNIFKHVDEWCSERGVDIFVFINTEVDLKEHTMKRGMVFYRPKESTPLRETYDDAVAFVNTLDEPFMLADKGDGQVEATGGRYNFWRIGNSAISRKKFEARIKPFYNC